MPHHVVDVVRPDEDMTAQRFVELADRAIADVAARGKHVIVCGGTGLYVRALLLGLFDGPPASPELRAELTERRAARRAGGAARRARADRSGGAAKIDRNDEKRIDPRARGVPADRRADERAPGPPRSPVARRRATRRGSSASRRSATRCTGAIDRARRRDDRRRASSARSPRCAPRATCRRCAPSRRSATPSCTRRQTVASRRARAIELIKRNSRHYARRQLSWYRADRRDRAGTPIPAPLTSPTWSGT